MKYKKIYSQIYPKIQNLNPSLHKIYYATLTIAIFMPLCIKYLLKLKPAFPTNAALFKHFSGKTKSFSKNPT